MPMASQSHSLVIFSSISMKHTLSCAVHSKKRDMKKNKSRRLQSIIKMPTMLIKININAALSKNSGMALLLSLGMCKFYVVEAISCRGPPLASPPARATRGRPPPFPLAPPRLVPTAGGAWKKLCALPGWRRQGHPAWACPCRAQAEGGLRRPWRLRLLAVAVPLPRLDPGAGVLDPLPTTTPVRFPILLAPSLLSSSTSPHGCCRAETVDPGLERLRSGTGRGFDTTWAIGALS
jgi:hypothetical protein